MLLMPKHQFFEYLLNSLLKWYSEGESEKDNDLSILKSLKLLFLITAADIEINKSDFNNIKEDLLIFNTFNNFCALPLGHVESDIYDYIKKTRGSLSSFSINRSTLTKLNDNLIRDQKSCERIDIAIDYLKDNFPKLISMKAYELVELTHKWNSWKLFYNTKYMSSIPREVIIEETKFFS